MDEKTDSIINPFHAQEDVWMRVSAWLSTLAPTSQRTYAGVIREYCQFLKCDVGSYAAARAILGADPMVAVAYREWCLQQRGQTPRALRKQQEAERRVTVTHPHIRSRPDGLQHTAGNATVAKKLACLRKLYKQLNALRTPRANPFDSTECRPPKAKDGRKRPTEMIKFDQVRALLDAPNLATEKGIRDKAILSIMLGGGLRVGEVRELRLLDVKHTELGTMVLQLRATKNKSDAGQSLPFWAQSAVHELYMLRLGQGATPTDYLINSYAHGGIPSSDPMSSQGLYKLFLSYSEKAGLEGYVTPHSARATAITKLLADGKSHREVQDFSRHSSVAMVEGYDKEARGYEKNPGLELKF